VTFHQPDLADVQVTRLADYGLGLYASRGYLAGRGGSLTREQLADADFVWFIESLQELPELRSALSGARSRVVFYATSVLGQQAAVAAATGVGLLPHSWPRSTTGWCGSCPTRSASAGQAGW